MTLQLEIVWDAAWYIFWINLLRIFYIGQVRPLFYSGYLVVDAAFEATANITFRDYILRQSVSACYSVATLYRPGVNTLATFFFQR